MAITKIANSLGSKYNDALVHLQNCEMILRECTLKCGRYFTLKHMEIHCDCLCENLEVDCENCEKTDRPNKTNFHHDCFEILKQEN